MYLKIINQLAEQLSIYIEDYDVALLVARYYVSLRVNQSIRECRDYHYDRLINNISFRECYCPFIRQGIVPIQNTVPIYRHGPHSPDFKSWYLEFKSILRYLQSKKGFHQYYWAIPRSAWSIPYNSNDIITLKDKLEDLRNSPSSITKSHSFQTFDWLADS